MTFMKEIMRDWKQEAEIKEPIGYSSPYAEGMFKVYTSHPGAMIGKGGMLYNKYKARIVSSYPDITGIQFIEPYNWVY